MENADEAGISDAYRRDFSPAQWEDFMERAKQRAHDARARALPDVARSVGRLLYRLARGTATALGRSWRAYARWRKHQRAMAQLAALDNHMLKDIGIDRSEIEAAVRGRDADDMLQRQLAA